MRDSGCTIQDVGAHLRVRPHFSGCVTDGSARAAQPRADTEVGPYGDTGRGDFSKCRGAMNHPVQPKNLNMKQYQQRSDQILDCRPGAVAKRAR